MEKLIIGQMFFYQSLDEEAAISYSFKSKEKVVVLIIKLKGISDFISRFKKSRWFTYDKSL
ncbi:MAG: hypothetical protein U5K55_12580 [Aliarcobacter sp.]|nr:hypothetical protein [Aliarcobacter sp.]